MEILETFFRRDRFYVRVQNGNGIKTLPRANFVWLQGNPSFKEIPKGYVIHHLDLDKSNDDISNLVIMQKFHHAAYHWKQKTFVSMVVTNRSAETYLPLKQPKVYANDTKKNGYYRIYFREYDEDGKTRPVILNSDEDGVFKTRKRAQEYADRLWSNSLILPNELTTKMKNKSL